MRPNEAEQAGWIKTVAGQERTKFRGRERVGRAFTFAAAAYNLASAAEAMGLRREGCGHLRLIGRWRIAESDLWDRGSP
jgi:hypothetical protein